MASNGHPVHSRAPHGANGAAPMNGAYQQPTRVLTVDEALPFTPITSIVPFNSDILPLPTVGLKSSVSLYPTQTERDNARQGLESLNREVANPQNTSQRLQRTLNDLKDLLRPESLSQYKFKTTPKFNPGPATEPLPEMNLSPFAQKLLNETAIEFTCPSPKPPIRPLAARQSSHTPKTPNKSKSNQAQHRQHLSANQKAHTQNSTLVSQVAKKPSKLQVATPPQASPEPSSQTGSNIAVVIPSLPNEFKRQEYTPSKKLHSHSVIRPPVKPGAPDPHYLPQQSLNSEEIEESIVVEPRYPEGHPQAKPETPKKLAPQPSPLAPASASSLSVVIPDLPTTFRADEYGVVPDSPDTPQHLSRKRERLDVDEFEDDLALTVDLREKADAAARNLRESLFDIFEAEDQIQPDNYVDNQYFTTSRNGITLNVITQAKVESLLQKIISVGRFSQVPLDELLRLQKLSEGALKGAENVDVKVDDSMGESEVDLLLQQMDTVELGLKAARTSLRLVSGGREEKQLYSEDIIQSALNSFKNVVESCIIPIVEMRATGSSAATFKILSTHKKTINNLLTQCRRVLSILANLVASIELSDTVVNTLEFTASRLIFVENAPTEKDSILGVAKFDSLRVVAMDALAQIFLCNPTQRQGIFDEILTSLEKLPVGKQSARQFKLAEGGSIQLVSALIMRLVQTSANKPDDAKSKRTNRALEALNGDDGDETTAGAQAQQSSRRYTITSETRAEQQSVTAIQELQEEVSPLLDTARANASYVVAFIVNRAMNSTKSGDTPYRNLLDLFVEDFITCLNSTDWPAAELLLRLFLFKMVHLAEGDKTATPAKNMALDLLGMMGSAISELNSHVRKISSSMESGDDLAQYLVKLAFASLEKRSSPTDLVAWSCGPFRVSLEYLEQRCTQDPEFYGAAGFLMAQWASKISSTFDSIDEDYEIEHGKLAYRLRMMIADRRWLSTEYSFDSVDQSHARLAFCITLLHSQFCESFGRVLSILLGSMNSEHATVRSKSLKSIDKLLDTDPTILDREAIVLSMILRCANDSSAQVRDSTLNVIGKCINLRPDLEEEMIPGILQRVNDSGVGVRKRAMRLSKDIYLRNLKREVRSSIADSLLHRVVDLDEGVQELARQTVEEVWMSPFYQPASVDDTSAQFRLGMSDHVALMVKTVQRGGGVASVLDKVLKHMLSNKSKNAAANFKVCKALVATMFETIIDNSGDEGSELPSAKDALQVLMIFAKANAKLFTPEQIQLLQPYTSNIGGGDDLLVFRYVVVIFRHVLPHLSKVHNTFLAEVRKALLVTISTMSRQILDDVMACLWIISDTLGDLRHLTRVCISSLKGIHQMKAFDFGEGAKPDQLAKINRLLLISGMVGKHCDLDSHGDEFRVAFPFWNDKSVAKLMCQLFAPYASPSKPIEIRKSALDAIGLVGQSWPKNFSSANIYTAFLEVFGEENAALETIILTSFKDFLLLEEKRSEADKEDALPGSAADPQAKLGVMGGGQGDGVALGIAQRFLPHVIRIALSRQDDQGLLATEVIGSVARQGLVHPKECGVPLIALETSPNAKIAEIAFREHRAVHEKHETILEKEYMRAVLMAYTYQRDVVEDTHGATLNPFTSKLHYMIEVLKISKVKNRKKFFETLCSRIDFDPAKIELSAAPHHLDYSQFIIENMAFFEYATVDELLTAITSMEKVVAMAGTGVAHSIETDIFNINLEHPPGADVDGQPLPVQSSVNPDRLQLLTASSILLSNLWGARTYLRRQYGLMNNKKENKSKGAAKDLNRAPQKLPGVTADKFWEELCVTMAALESPESMMNQCRAFVELLSVDHDFKVAAEGDDEADRDKLGTPSEDEDGTPGPPGSGRGRKRKGTGTPGGRKKRPRSSSATRGRGRPKGSGKKQSSVERSDDEENWE